MTDYKMAVYDSFEINRLVKICEAQTALIRTLGETLKMTASKGHVLIDEALVAYRKWLEENK